MGERKVINKYIPADFDPALIPRGTKLSKKDGTVPVRMMLPFTVQCESCNTFLYRGRKFNSKKEAMGGPDGRYLGIQRWRFYIKCNHCSRTVTFLTDPKNADYEMESGGTRTYEVYKDKRKKEEEAAVEKEEAEKEDAMKALENRVLDSQREMADLDNLEEIRAMNKRHLRLGSGKEDDFNADTEAVLKARDAKEKKTTSEDLGENGTTAEEEEMIKSIKFGQPKVEIKRLSEEDEAELERNRRRELALFEKQNNNATKKTLARPAPIVKVKRRRVEQPPSEENGVHNSGKTSGLASLLGGYGSESDSD